MPDVYNQDVDGPLAEKQKAINGAINSLRTLQRNLGLDELKSEAVGRHVARVQAALPDFPDIASYAGNDRPVIVNSGPTEEPTPDP